jgi:RNA polymerase sigma factor (sigma-70 family)
MDESDFRAFLGLERQRFVNYVRTLVHDMAELDAEDIVQDVFVRLLEKADTTAPLDNLAAYVYRSLRNRVIDSTRTRKRTESLEGDTRPEGERLVDILKDLKPNPLEEAQTREGREALFAALAHLSETERAVVIAHEFEGVPFKKLAAEWQTPINTLLSHKSRAIKKLRDYLADSKGARR